MGRLHRDARHAGDYRGLPEDADLRVTVVEPHTQALDRIIRQIAARLDLLKIIARPRLNELGVDLTRTGPVLHAAHTAVRDGILDDVLVVAHKP